MPNYETPRNKGGHRHSFQPERERPQQLASEKIPSGNRLYFLDLIENHRGRYIKLAECPERGPRITSVLDLAAIPAIIESLSRLHAYHIQNPT